MSSHGYPSSTAELSEKELEQMTRPENESKMAESASGNPDSVSSQVPGGEAAHKAYDPDEKPRKAGRPKGSKPAKKAEAIAEAQTSVKVLSLEDIALKGHTHAQVPRVANKQRVTQYEFQLALAALEKLPTRNPNEITLGESERSQALVDTGAMHSLVLKNYSLQDIVQLMEDAGTPVKAKAVQLRYIHWLKKNGLEMPDYYRGKLSLAEQGGPVVNE